MNTTKYSFLAYDLNFIQFVRTTDEGNEVLYTFMAQMDFINPRLSYCTYDSGSQLYDVFRPCEAEVTDAQFLKNPLFAKEINRIQQRLFTNQSKDALRKLYRKHEESLQSDEDPFYPDLASDVISLIVKDLPKPFAIEFAPELGAVELVTHHTFPIPRLGSSYVDSLFSDELKGQKNQLAQVTVKTTYGADGTVNLLRIDNNDYIRAIVVLDETGGNTDDVTYIRSYDVHFLELSEEYHILFNTEADESAKATAFEDIWFIAEQGEDRKVSDNYADPMTLEYLTQVRLEPLVIIPLGNDDYLVGNQERQGEMVITNSTTLNHLVDINDETHFHFIVTKTGQNQELSIYDLLKVVQEELSRVLVEFAASSTLYTLTTDSMTSISAESLVRGSLEF